MLGVRVCHVSGTAVQSRIANLMDDLRTSYVVIALRDTGHLSCDLVCIGNTHDLNVSCLFRVQTLLTTAAAVISGGSNTR